MPNWCNNNINITGPANKIRDLWTEATIKEGFLDAMVPMPKELKDTTSPSDLDEEAQAEMIKKFGASDWYSWCVNNWGTKWDISTEGLEFTDNEDGTASIDGWFDSAWAPPIGAVAYYGQRNEDVSITLDYHEPGMAFVGRYTIENGIDDDDCLDYSGCNSKNVREVIGEDYDDNWGISDMMAEWDDEEEEA